MSTKLPANSAYAMAMSVRALLVSQLILTLSIFQDWHMTNYKTLDGISPHPFVYNTTLTDLIQTTTLKKSQQCTWC